ncbi:B-cell receptor CD22-like [Colossoma macropomum]|uniref:B-cell receptor CD22-like n=1 Tax=Colossoma macropomum TaxID=42526 RepID=UPI00186495CF|nr:B-cell receptor CD22-like [Colossoma macropomum]
MRRPNRAVEIIGQRIRRLCRNVAMLTLLRMNFTVSLVFLLFSGVVAQDGWAVNYNSKSFCALKGSAVTIECFYSYPSGHSVQKAFWTKELVTSGSEPPDLLDDPEYRGRSQYSGDKQQDCALRLKNVSEKDQSKYYFTFITDQPGGKYQGAGGVDLSVTDLQVEVPERVIEGDKVTLTCKTSCSLSVIPTFTWYRNGHRLSSSTDQLHLQLVSREDAGRYHCAVLGQNFRSPEVTLNVRYGPKSVSVSISPSSERVKGSSVTLTCSSNANPPVLNYTWFKEGGSSPVGSGHSYSVQQRGSYYCVAQNEYGSQKSAVMPSTLNGVGHTVLYAAPGVTVGCACLSVFIAASL